MDSLPWSCCEGAWGWGWDMTMLWLLQTTPRDFWGSSTLACCVALDTFLSLSGPKFPLLKDKWRHTYLTSACGDDTESG